jgi:hypothetical protein
MVVILGISTFIIASNIGNFTAFPKKDGCVVMADASTSGIFTITGAMEFFFNGLSIAKRRIRAFKKP